MNLSRYVASLRESCDKVGNAKGTEGRQTSVAPKSPDMIFTLVLMI